MRTIITICILLFATACECDSHTPASDAGTLSDSGPITVDDLEACLATCEDLACFACPNPCVEEARMRWPDNPGQEAQCWEDLVIRGHLPEEDLCMVYPDLGRCAD